MHYIASGKRDRTVRDFFDSGEQDVARHLDPVLKRLNYDPKDKRLIWFGRPNSMYRVPIQSKAMRDHCRAAGLTVEEITGTHSQYMWFAGRKWQPQ